MSRLEKVLIIPDVHCPYEDKKAWALMMKAMRDWSPHHIVVMGDFIDCYSVSSHSKDPNRVLQLKDEVEASIKLLQELQDLGAKNNVFLAGNHEDRLERYLTSYVLLSGGLCERRAPRRCFFWLAWRY